MKLDSDKVLPAILALSVIVAASATLFGFRFAPEAHGDGGADDAVAEEAEVGAMHDEAEEEHDHEEGSSGGQIAASILVSIGGGALVLLTVQRTNRRQLAGRIQAETEHAPGPGSDLRSVLALLSVGAAIVHFVVIAPHFDEWWVTGTFFTVVAVFQLTWAISVLRRPSSLLYLSGAVVNVLVVLIWIVSRTTGIPVGPTTGEPEAVGLPDILATAYEVLVVAAAFALVLGVGPKRRRLLPLAAVTGTWVSCATVVSLTAVALALLE